MAEGRIELTSVAARRIPVRGMVLGLLFIMKIC